MRRSNDEQNGKRKLLRDELVQEVLRQLRGSLEHGLWIKSPRYPEKFELRGNSFALDLWIACFTEWSFGESLPHTAEYGRIGLGFPKRRVIERGGQSVTYFRHNAKGSFLPAVFKQLKGRRTNLLPPVQARGSCEWSPIAISLTLPCATRSRQRVCRRRGRYSGCLRPSKALHPGTGLCRPSDFPAFHRPPRSSPAKA